MNRRGSSSTAASRSVVRSLKVFRNTWLQAPLWFYRLVVTDSKYEAVLNKPLTSHRSGIRRVLNVVKRLRRIALAVVWFWPRIGEAHRWSQADSESNWSPALYLRSEPRRLLQMIMANTNKEWHTLDLGCNSGADLHLLWQAGWRKLYGVDAGAHALNLFESTFPSTFASAEITRDLFQRYLLRTPAKRFDVVYSNGATIELVHPSFPVVEQICRVTRRLIALDIYELGSPYPRDYVGTFERHGFSLVYCLRPEDRVRDSSLLLFERTSQLREALVPE